jgi:hypothetical protein
MFLFLGDAMDCELVLLMRDKTRTFWKVLFLSSSHQTAKSDDEIGRVNGPLVSNKYASNPSLQL